MRVAPRQCRMAMSHAFQRNATTGGAYNALTSECNAVVLSTRFFIDDQSALVATKIRRDLRGRRCAKKELFEAKQ